MAQLVGLSAAMPSGGPVEIANVGVAMLAPNLMERIPVFAWQIDKRVFAKSCQGCVQLNPVTLPTEPTPTPGASTEASMQGYGNNLLLAAALAVAGIGAVYTAPAEARVSVSIYAPMAPPALRVETVPTLRAGYVWAPGYWGWNNHRYVWHRGRQMRSRHGYRYAPPRWEQNGNRWRYQGERWEH